MCVDTSETNVCTTRTNIGFMPTRGHDGKVRAGSATKVCAVRAGYAHTLLGVAEQSMCIDSRISGLATVL